MRWAGILLLLAAIAWPFASSRAQRLPLGIKDPPLPLGDASPLPRANPQAAVSFLDPAQITVAARRPSVVDLEFHVASGLHINSHTPREKTLVATRLAIADERGLRITGVDFPPGADYSFAFSPKEKVSVYDGDFTLQAHLTAQPGEHRLEGLLRYQACDVNACMPPRTLPISIRVLAK